MESLLLNGICTGDAAVSGGGGTECGTSDNGDTVSSVMSPGSPYTTVTIGSGCAVGKGRGWLMPASSLMMAIVALQSWHGVQSTMWEGVTWSWWLELWTGIGTSRSWGIKCCHERRWCLDVTLWTSKTMPHPIQQMTRQPFFNQQDAEVMDCPARSPDMNPIEHVWDQMSVWIGDMDEPPSAIAQLNNAVRQAWAAVRPGRVRTLVENMPRSVMGQQGNIMFHQYVVNCFNVPYWSLVLAPNVN